MNNDRQSDSKIRNAQQAFVEIKKTKKKVSFIVKHWPILLGIGLTLIIVLLFMFLVMVIELEGEDIESTENNNLSYSEATSNISGSGNEKMWWPIGSSNITSEIVLDDVTIQFRSDRPDTNRITSYYSDVRGSHGHSAIDIAGSNLYLIAMADGVVKSLTCPDTSNGQCAGTNVKPNSSLVCSRYDQGVGIRIDFNNGYSAYYYHVESNSIPKYLQPGTKVYQGQVIAKMGNTGCSTGPHVHLQVSTGGTTFDPLEVINKTDNRPLEDGVKKSEDILKEYTYNDVEENIEADGTFVLGKDNKQTICKTFKNYGYPDSGVAALMVNMYKESSFDNKVINSSNCVGLVQWCGGRRDQLMSKYGKDDWKLISNQLEMIYTELNSGNYNKSNNSLKSKDNTVYQKSVDFCSDYERPARTKEEIKEHCINRANSVMNDKNLSMQMISDYVSNGCEGDI